MIASHFKWNEHKKSLRFYEEIYLICVIYLFDLGFVLKCQIILFDIPKTHSIRSVSFIALTNETGKIKRKLNTDLKL